MQTVPLALVLIIYKREVETPTNTVQKPLESINKQREVVKEVEAGDFSNIDFPCALFENCWMVAWVMSTELNLIPSFHSKIICEVLISIEYSATAGGDTSAMYEFTFSAAVSLIEVRGL